MLHGHELWNRGELPHTSNTLEIYKNHVFRTGQFCFFKTYEWCRTSAGVCSRDGAAGVAEKKSTQNHGNNIILLDGIHFTIHSAIVPCPPPPLDQWHSGDTENDTRPHVYFSVRLCALSNGRFSPTRRGNYRFFINKNKETVCDDLRGFASKYGAHKSRKNGAFSYLTASVPREDYTVLSRPRGSTARGAHVHCCLGDCVRVPPFRLARFNF